MTAQPVLKDIVLLGAGHAHVSVLRMFGMKPVPGVRLTLITRQADTPYSGMLPGMIAGFYSFDDAHIDVGPLCGFAGARLYHSAGTGLDLRAKHVLCDNRPPVPYDLLSINTGSTPNMRDIPGASGGVIPVKPIDSFLARFEAARGRILAQGAKARVAVIGAGAGGTELALSLERRLRHDAAAAGLDAGGLHFAIVTPGPTILPGFPGAVVRRFSAEMRNRGVEIHAGARVAGVDGGTVRLDNGAAYPFDEIFWTTEAAPAPWLAQTGLALDGRGFIAMRNTLQTTSHPEVFAAGDIAAIEGHSLPKSGVYAVRQGPVLAENLRRAITGQVLKPYRPQRDALYLISTGERYAVGTRNGVTFEGAWVWRLKDWIDRRFMAKFNALPEMKIEAEALSSPVTGKAAIKAISGTAKRGGLKAGAAVLSRAPGAIEPASRNGAVTGPGALDDAVLADTAGPDVCVHTVDPLPAAIDDPYISGKIAANHALGDIYAMGAEPQTAFAIATVPQGIEAKLQADLSSMMTGAGETLREANCALAGGHTSEGAELSLGFTVTCLAERGLTQSKTGARPGDALILTQPLGTGLLLAAGLRGKAKARWVLAALSQMTRSSREAALILRRHGAYAVTHVAGRGLLGHLVEMVKGSGVDTTLALTRIPLLPGVRETIAQRIFSPLQTQNERFCHAVRNGAEAARDPLYPVLFDPQTAGGLLASVPAAQAQDCVKALQEAGYDGATVIGQAHSQADVIAPVVIALGPWVMTSQRLANETVTVSAITPHKDDHAHQPDQ